MPGCLPNGSVQILAYPTTGPGSLRLGLERPPITISGMDATEAKPIAMEVVRSVKGPDRSPWQNLRILIARHQLAAQTIRAARGGCGMFMEMYGNGARIFMTTRARTGFAVVAAGSIRPCTAGLGAAPASRLTTGAATWAFVSP